MAGIGATSPSPPESPESGFRSSQKDWDRKDNGSSSAICGSVPRARARQRQLRALDSSSVIPSICAQAEEPCFFASPRLPAEKCFAETRNFTAATSLPVNSPQAEHECSTSPQPERDTLAAGRREEA